MRHRCISSLVGLLLLTGVVLAADQDNKGTLVSVDAKAIVIKGEEGKNETYPLGTDTKVVDAKGAAIKEGLKDKRFAPGVSVKVVMPEKGKTAKEVVFVSEKPEKPEPKEIKKGTPAKVVKIDAEKRTVQVQTEDKKMTTYTLGKDVQFIGPRGGVSKDDIKDDRFVAGAEIGIVLDAAGKNVTEIHLPVRKTEEAPKDKPKDKVKDK